MIRIRPSSSCWNPIGGTAKPMSIWPVITCVSVAGMAPVDVALALLL